MILNGNLLALLTGGLLVTIQVRGEPTGFGSDDRNYRVIIDRNPFALKPIPPPPTNAPPPIKQQDELLLTGITSIGTARAYFMSKAPQGKQPEYYSLAVDEKKGGLEVVTIDLESKSVRIRNAGLESLMTFASNGVKAPIPPSPPLPGSANPQVVNIPVPSPHPPGPTATVVNTPSAPTGAGRTRNIPSRNVRTPPANFAPGGEANQPPARPNPFAAEQDVLLMELQKRANPHVEFPPTPMPQ